MRNEKNHAGRCEKLTFSKHSGVCKTYSTLQLAYAEQLEQDDRIKEFRCNVPLSDIGLTDGSYTTDFLCTMDNGDKAVRECVFRKKLSLPRTCKLLDASREYWAVRGVIDWGLVIDAEGNTHE